MKKTSTLILRNSLLLLATLFTIFSLTATAQTKPAAARITQAIDEANLVPMHTKVHPLAKAEFDQGVVADSQPMNRMLLVLKRSPYQETALRNLMDEQQTKNSPNYHAWLTPAQFGQQFGVADADVQKVTAWLTQKGFTGIKTSPGSMFIEFNGTAGLVRNAFHTEMHNFMVKGEAHMANVSVPQIPAALAPVVTAVHSLNNFRKKSFMHYSQAAAQAKARGMLRPGFTATPCTPLGSPTCFAVGPADFAKIYNLPPTTGAGALDGTGQTIALVARSNINLQDIADFRTGFGLPANFTTANIILDGPDPGILPFDDAEATLDVEWSGAVAPNAKILLVVSSNALNTFADGADLSALYIVENNLAPIVSESFGLCEFESNDSFDLNMWEQAAAQGITAMVSTGDNGSASCDPDNFTNASDAGLQISGTASTPFNVAVGGTDFDDATNASTYWASTNSGAGLLSAKSYIPEITWNSGCASTATSTTLNTVCASIDVNPTPPNDPSPDLAGGSGGQSNCGLVDNSGNCQGYPKPVWQQLAGLTGMPQDGVRDIPDVSLYAAVNSASDNFYILCLANSALQNGQPCNLTGLPLVNGQPNYSFSGVGGTSASSPAFAGIIALVNQNEVAKGRLKAGEGQGNVNYVLYKLAVAQDSVPGVSACNSSLGPAGINSACTFNDVTKGNNSVPCVGSFPNPSVLGLLNTPNCSTQILNAVGVLVEPSSPAPFTSTTPAWTTTAGYDLATGLGSVNGANLVANWGSITGNFAGSTTTITAPAAGTVSITHGATVNFTIQVAQNSGTTVPTGDVSLIASPPGFAQVGIPGATLAANGTVTIPTDFLPGGTAYPVVAHYAGDGTFAASDSAPFNVTVAKEASKVAASLATLDVVSGAPTYNVTTTPYGSSYILIVNVTNNSGTPCVPPFPTTQGAAFPTTPCPTGTITLTDNGAPLKDFINTGSANTNTATLNTQGFAEDLQVQLPGGAHSLSASYAGDNSFSASTQAAPAAITITPASTSTGVTANGSSAATVTAGQTVTLVATVTGFNILPSGTFGSTGVGPTGTVTFSTCGTPPCTATVVPTAYNTVTGAPAFGTATLTTSFSTTGVKTISATFASGDLNYSGSASTASATVTVNAAGTFVVSYSPQPLVLSSLTGAASTLTVTVTPSNGFTGMVAVTPTAASLPPGVSCTPSPLNINVTGATAVTGQLMCSVTATSTVLTASNAREDRMLEAKAVPPTTGGKGWWTLSAGTGFAAMFLLFLPGGRKKFRAALGLAFVCILTLTAGCNGSGGGTIPPPKIATVTKLTANSGKVANGTAFTFSAAVTGGTPTGMVQLFDGTTMIGTAASVAAGTAVPTAPALTVGTHAISAQYLGDATTKPSASGTLNLTVTGSTTIAITTSPAATPAAPAINVTVQ
jgi:hypothetical protein